jgi:hypothetical protein
VNCDHHCLLRRISLWTIFCLFGCWLFVRPSLPGLCWAQSASDDSGSIHGVVINSVTHEPIDRALVFSPDNRFATLTNSEGRFEFALAKTDPANGGSNRPYTLMARKPGFLSDPNQPANLLNDPSFDGSKYLTLTLTPEAVLAGTVTLPTSEAPDSITLELFRRQVQDGRARWVQAGATRSMSDGQFRFADLQAGSYKLLTSELLDTDPTNTDPANNDPLNYDPVLSARGDASGGRGSLFGYPPVYYQGAADFESASVIQLAAGQTQTVNLSLVKQAYYRVKVPVIVPGSDQPEYGLQVTVYAHGHKGPGFSLGHNPAHHAIEGMLPNGTYTVEATVFRPNGTSMTGLQTITIKGGPIDGPAMVLAPNGLIAVNVKEEFTTADQMPLATFSGASHSTVLKGPRRYLNVTLETADDFGTGRNASLRNPTGPGDEALVIEGASAGSYWVKVYSSRGYTASIRSGNLDLLHQPLVIGAGGATSPIEITMRDDGAEISGTVEGITSPAQGAGSVGTGQSRVHIYCIPLADSSGYFSEIGVQPDGSFDYPGLPPGAYRLLAFDGATMDPTQIEYRNPEAMQAYDAKGLVVHLTSGQKERVTLPMIATER